MITHTHLDHIGSLGTLVHYFHYVKNSNANIIYSKVTKYNDDIKNKVYCMHLNNESCIEKAKELGFNVVETKKIK